MYEDVNPPLDWKERLRQDFERWLATINEAAASELEAAPAMPEPDLYAFFEQLASANVENRKANRRTAEALSQWGDTLVRFDGDLRQLREHLDELESAPPEAEDMPRATCLSLVEILDRMHRLAAAFRQSPPKSWWGSDAAWRQAWNNQRQGFDILISHLETLLKQEGITRLETLGKPFDPALMVAVAAEPATEYPPQTVIEEIAAGYLRHGELLRVAQVKVSLNPPTP